MVCIKETLAPSIVPVLLWGLRLRQGHCCERGKKWRTKAFSFEMIRSIDFQLKTAAIWGVFKEVFGIKFRWLKMPFVQCHNFHKIRKNTQAATAPETFVSKILTLGQGTEKNTIRWLEVFVKLIDQGLLIGDVTWGKVACSEGQELRLRVAN